MTEAKIQAKPTLRSSVRYLKGVGPEKQKILARLGLEVLGDLFYLFPRRYEKRFPVKKIRELKFADKECVEGRVLGGSFVRRRGLGFYRVRVSDGDGALEAVYYNQPWLSTVFREGARVFLYGKAEKEGPRLRMVHPEYEVAEGEAPTETVHTGRWTPVYPLTEDLSQKALRQLVWRVTREHADLARETLPSETCRRHSLIGIAEALRGIHFPPDTKTLARAYERLVFDEFFALELLMEMKKAAARRENEKLLHEGGEESLARWVSSLPFELTAGQRAALDAAVRDMTSGRPMNRLVQGDVGSGKTAVAAGALYFTAMNGFQGALMAPTEVLAQQLYFEMRRFLEPHGLAVGYLAQGLDAASKEKALARLASGDIHVAVGTHALLGEKVCFRRLGLAIVDEQHKFGVFQRQALKEKGLAGSHFLLMTATPIPRTLSMTLYGDMDVSTIVERPAGRRPVRTYWVGEEKRAGVYRWLDAFIGEGAQAYVVCPKIDAGADERGKNAASTFERLKKTFPDRRLALLHGRMKPAEKKKAMEDFKAGRADILVSTVVIEVGVDVPSARCILIESAEEFGLAQLHQLRGRVGRGSEESYCVLFSESANAETAERLSAFEDIDSGFDIAEKDLEQRGAGEVFGEKQHGVLPLRIGDLVRDRALLERAKEEARRFVEADPLLESAPNRELKRLLRERFGDAEKAKALS